MADIKIQHSHQMDPESLRSHAKELAGKLADEYQMSMQWQENQLLFQRSGVRGCLILGADEVLLEVKLGLLMKPLKGTFEKEIKRFLLRYLS